MLKILSDLLSNGKWASIFTNYTSEKFDYGKVIAFNGNDIAVQMITPDGEDDGITVMNAEKIFRIDIGGQYSEKMEKLCEENKIPKYDLKVEDGDIFLSALLFAQREDQIVSVELFDSGYFDAVGIPEISENNECILKVIDEYGCEDEISYFSIESVTKISISSKEEKRLMKLWRFNNE